VDVEIHIVLSSALVAGEWFASRPGPFAPEERVPRTHWIRSRLGLKAAMNAVEMRTFFTPPNHFITNVVMLMKRWISWTLPGVNIFV
jgi:hypothetical protein